MASGSLATAPVFSAVDNVTGLPLAGGLLYTYASGTNTPLATYTSQSLATQMPNPIILNNYGEAQFWLGPNPYRFQLINAAGVQQSPYPIDNIQGNVSLAALASATLGADGAGIVGYTPGSHSASTVGSALDAAGTLETNLPLTTLATNGAGLVGYSAANGYAVGTVGYGINTLNTFTVNLALTTLSTNGAGLVGYSSGNTYAAGTVGYTLNNLAIGSNFNKINFNLYTDASPALGDMWTDTTQQTLCVNEGASTANLVKVYKGGALAVSKVTGYTVNIAATSTNYSLIQGFGSNFNGSLSIPANFLVLGKTIKIEVYGTISNGTSAVVTLFPLVGSASLPSVTPTLAVGTYGVKLEVVMSCYATGAGSGKVYTSVQLSGGSGFGLNPVNAGSDGGITLINTTIANNLDVQISVSAGTSSSFTVSNAIISVLG